MYITNFIQADLHIQPSEYLCIINFKIFYVNHEIYESSSKASICNFMHNKTHSLNKAVFESKDFRFNLNVLVGYA